MGWKGNLRTGISIVRKMEQAEKRRSSNIAKQYKAMQKQQAFENGKNAVQEYNDYIDHISSAHKESSESIDWHEILNEKEPVKPILLEENQRKAEINLKNYNPSFFDNLLRLQSKKIKKLEALILTGKDLDKKEFNVKNDIYEKENNEWLLNQDLAKGILSNDISAYNTAIEYLDLFSELTESGNGVNIVFHKDYAEITLFANGISIIPDFILTQTATGKVSKKKMPIGKYHEYYQEYICSCVLRIAREMFSYFPLNYIFVNVLNELVNPVNGLLENQTILSVAIPKETISTLNFEAVDPSESMKNFIHKMKFSKTTGFSFVPNISPKELNLN